MCKDDHRPPPKFAGMTRAEAVEYLRKIHEEFCMAVYQYNDSVNPQLLLCIVGVLVVTIVQIYSVIIYVGFNISTLETRTIHVLNWMSVVTQTFGFFLVLKSAQIYRNMVRSISSLEESLLSFSMCCRWLVWPIYSWNTLQEQRLLKNINKFESL